MAVGERSQADSGARGEQRAERDPDLRAERRLLAEERERYRDLFELAPDAYLVTDANARILELNRAASALFNVPPARLVGQSLTGFLARSERRAFQEHLRRLDRSDAVQEWEVCLSPADRGPLDACLTVVEVRGPNGDLAELRWIVRDISERKRVEEQGRLLTAELGRRAVERAAELEVANRKLDRLLSLEQKSRARLTRLLERLHQGVVTVSPDLTVEFANAAAGELLQQRLDEGERLPEPWEHFSLQAFAKGLFETGATAQERLVTHARGDDERTFAVLGLPAGDWEAAILILTDVSQRERRERAEREFITNAAHELQTPLTAVTSATEVLQAGAKHVPEERDRFLRHIERECARLARLTRALLVLARAQTLAELPEPEPVELRTLLQEVASGVRPAQGVAVEVRCKAGIAVQTNRELVEQALLNLGENAARYTESGRIVFTARPASRKHGSVAIEVRDTGRGIPAPERERVFDRFYRGGSRDGDGFGLGLAIAWQAIRALGGELEIESVPGKGTIARVTLDGAHSGHW